MSLILGIDTGGTYTDGVIVELGHKQILNKGKALTTREDLAIGIRNCIDNLDFDQFAQISVVSLSTTLATNATVEGRGGQVGLILIGHEPIDKLPVEHYSVVAGGHNIHGFPTAELDEAEVRQAIDGLRGLVDAVAVSGYLSVRNPEHELKVKAMVREILDVPIVCAHQLTTTLGFQERTVTAALNARLIPIIEELILSVKKVLQEKNIKANIMMVKGDGSLMGEDMAREKPIDTILSGPAASIIGGTFLTDVEDALVLDMGGTTTDIALLKNGAPHINREGASVGGWLTRVQAAEIYTYGLGGDSYIQVTRDGELQVGPQRVWPIAVVAAEYPYLLKELNNHFIQGYDLVFAQATDCFMLMKNSYHEGLNSWEGKVIRALEKGPHSLYYLAQVLDMDPNLFSLQHLTNLGIVSKISMTPTDILHAQGVYTKWHQEAAVLGVKILAARLGKTEDEFIKMAAEAVIKELSLACTQSLLSGEGQSLWLKDNDIAMLFIDKALNKQKNQLINCSLQMDLPIVGIGAPVEAWLPKVAERMHTRLVIPSHAEVANAVGAATGKIMETIKVLIKPGGDDNDFILHAPWERKTFTSFAEASAYALDEAKRQAASVAARSGAKDYELLVNQEDVYVKIFMTENDIFVESRIEVTAVGRPDWS